MDKIQVIVEASTTSEAYYCSHFVIDLSFDQAKFFIDMMDKAKMMNDHQNIDLGIVYFSGLMFGCQWQIGTFLREEGEGYEEVGEKISAFTVKIMENGISFIAYGNHSMDEYFSHGPSYEDMLEIRDQLDTEEMRKKRLQEKILNRKME